MDGVGLSRKKSGPSTPEPGQTIDKAGWPVADRPVLHFEVDYSQKTLYYIQRFLHGNNSFARFFLMKDLFSRTQLCRLLALSLAAATPAFTLCFAEATPTGIYREARPLLHTFVEIKAFGDRAQIAVRAAFDEIERVNHLLNNYDPKSEVSTINRAAGQGVVSVSPETLEAIAGAKYYGDLSDGALDITIGPLLKVWGFARETPGTPEPPSAASLDRAKRLVSYRLIQLDAIRGVAGLPQEGMWIDTGSFAKGYVVDRAAKLLKSLGVARALITAGGTIFAMGNKKGDIPWRVGIRHPREEGKLLGSIPLVDQAVSTSGDYERFYRHGGRRICHIIDPRSGQPVKAVQGISVIAPTALASDALSTSLFVLGVREGLALVKNLPETEAMIVDEEGRVHCSPGWPASDERRPSDA